MKLEVDPSSPVPPFEQIREILAECRDLRRRLNQAYR